MSARFRCQRRQYSLGLLTGAASDEKGVISRDKETATRRRNRIFKVDMLCCSKRVLDEGRERERKKKKKERHAEKEKETGVTKKRKQIS